VEPALAGRELFAGSVAHGDHDVGVEVVVGDGAGTSVAEVEAGPDGGGDRPGMHAIRGVGAGAPGVVTGAPAPEGSGELGPGGVLRAHEQRPPPPSRGLGPEVTEGVVAEPDVAASPVAGGHGPFDQAGSFEHVEVVGQQVACEPEPLGRSVSAEPAGWRQAPPERAFVRMALRRLPQM
jgi:hypothetical protein